MSSARAKNPKKVAGTCCHSVTNAYILIVGSLFSRLEGGGCGRCGPAPPVSMTILAIREINNFPWTSGSLILFPAVVLPDSAVLKAWLASGPASWLAPPGLEPLARAHAEAFERSPDHDSLPLFRLR